MILIVGLGNPGKKYQNTRHNFGFMVLEKIAQKKEIVFRLEPTYKARFADYARLPTPEAVGNGGQGNLDNRIKLVEPQEYMNNSGAVIKKIKDYWRVDDEDIWVVYDEVDLALGKIRITYDGSSAGHKGVQSIIDKIGKQFWRLRIGIGKNDSIPTEQWVLMDFSPKEKKVVAKVIDATADLVLSSLSSQIKEQTTKVN